MAIRIEAKNITINIKKKHEVHVLGKIEKTASKVNIEATKNNLTLSSNKQIISLGNKK